MQSILEKYKIPKRKWNDWKWQLQNRLITEDCIMTPYTASLISAEDKKDPVLLTYKGIKKSKKKEKEDPLCEEKHTVTPNIIHKYKDRCLFLVSNKCASYCKYCTRSRLKNKNVSSDFSLSYDYLRANPQIKQVVISGGDPLLLEDKQLSVILTELRRIKSIEVIRIGTKVPVNLPMRITKSLIRVLKKAKPLIMAIHICHPNEITPEFSEACRKLNEGGILLNSQSVLLKDINDSSRTLIELFPKLMKNYVTPYALYDCDNVTGAAPYRVSMKKGIKIMDKVRKKLTGVVIPTYYADIPGKKSKTLICSKKSGRVK